MEPDCSSRLPKHCHYVQLPATERPEQGITSVPGRSSFRVSRSGSKARSIVLSRLLRIPEPRRALRNGSRYRVRRAVVTHEFPPHVPPAASRADFEKIVLCYGWCSACKDDSTSARSMASAFGVPMAISPPGAVNSSIIRRKPRGRARVRDVLRENALVAAFEK